MLQVHRWLLVKPASPPGSTTRGIALKKSILIAAALGVVAAASPAMAQDVSQFTGAKATALVGVDIVKLESPTLDFDGSRTGVAYGGSIGYDAAWNGFVFGAEAELADSSAKYEEEGVDYYGSIRTGRDIYVGVRAGVPVAPSALLYVKGGYTNARFKINATDATETVSLRSNADGFRLGAGTEVAKGNVFGRLEYRYSDYAKLRFGNVRSDAETSRHQVVAGLGVRF